MDLLDLLDLQSYVNKAKQQFIDSNGKCRALIYPFRGHNITLLTRPMPPTMKPIAPAIIVNPVAPIEVVLKFCQEMGLLVVKQHRAPTTGGSRGEGEAAKGGRAQPPEDYIGLTVTNPNIPLLESAYIITKYSTPLRGVEVTIGSANPVSTSTSSAFDAFRRSRKTADILMAYVLWTYSSSENGVEDRPKWNDESESENFVVISPREIDNYEADLLSLGSRLFYENNDTIYDKKGRIKVPNKITITKLLSWLSVRKVRTPHLVEGYWENKTIPDYYKTISDFSASEHQLVFTNIEGLMRWRKNVKSTKSTKNQIVATEIDPATPNPYFYFWGDQLVVLQNVKDGDKKLADFVASYWTKHRRNPGHNPKAEGEGKAALVKIGEVLPESKNGYVSVVDGNYFSILVLEKT